MTKPTRRPRARINAVIRGRAVSMTGLEHQFKRFNRRYPQVAKTFEDATEALAKLTGGKPTAVGALGITRITLRASGTAVTIPRSKGTGTAVVATPGLRNELAPYYARLYNARRSQTTGIRYDTRRP